MHLAELDEPAEKNRSDCGAVGANRINKIVAVSEVPAGKDGMIITLWRKLSINSI